MLLVHDSDGKIIYDLSDYNIIIHEDGTDGLTKERYEKGKFTYLNLVHKDDDPSDADKVIFGVILPKSAYMKITKNKLRKRLKDDDFEYIKAYAGSHIFSSWKYRLKEWLREQWIMIFHVTILGRMVHTDYELMELRKQTIKDYKEYMKALKEIKKRPDYDRNKFFEYVKTC